MEAGSSSNLVIAFLVGPFLAVVPALIDSSLLKRPIAKPWFLYCLPGVAIAFLMMEGSPHFLWEITGIPVLILCAGAVAAGGVHRKISNPSPQAIMKIALAAGVVAVVASYLGYSEGQKFRNGIDEGVDAKQDKSRQAMPATHSVRDKGYYMSGFQQRMTREQVLAVFGPPEIARDAMLAYRAVRPENGKDTLCFFYFSSEYTVDGRSRVSELRC